MTMKDRKVLSDALQGCYRMQARGDGIAKRRSKAKASAKETSAEAAAAEAVKQMDGPDLTDPKWRFDERVANLVAKGNSKEEAEATVRRVILSKEVDPLPVAKGVTGPLGELVNGQRFFVSGVVGDFLLEGWKLAPGIFDAKGDLRRCPEVRQIVRHRTATRPEQLLKAQLMNAWFEETKVTVLEDFALQNPTAALQSSQAQKEQGGIMAKEKKAKAPKKEKVAAAPKQASLYSVIKSKIDAKLQGQLENKEKNSHGVVVLRVLAASQKALGLDEIITLVKATKLYKTAGNHDHSITRHVHRLAEKGVLKAQEA